MTRLRTRLQLAMRRLPVQVLAFSVLALLVAIFIHWPQIGLFVLAWVLVGWLWPWRSLEGGGRDGLCKRPGDRRLPPFPRRRHGGRHVRQREEAAVSFVLNIDASNAAFAEVGPATEVARILRCVADKVDSWDSYQQFQTVSDINGNEVGRFRLTQESGS